MADQEDFWDDCCILDDTDDDDEQCYPIKDENQDEECYVIDSESDYDSEKDIVLTNSVSSQIPSYPYDSSMSISELNRPEVSIVSNDALYIMPTDQRSPEAILGLNSKCESLILDAFNNFVQLQKSFRNVQYALMRKIALKKSIERPIHDKKKALLFNCPFFFDVRNFHPPKNQDAFKRKRRRYFDTNFVLPRQWTPKESANLIRVAKDNAVDTSVKPFKIRYDYLKSKLELNEYFTVEDEQKIENEVAQLEEKMESIRLENPDIHLERNSEKLDWLHISCVNLRGVRSADDCENIYKYYLHRSINKARFTTEEDARLKALALSHNERNWEAIAEKLGTNRTGSQCHQRYVCRLKEHFRKKIWTPKDDENLIQVIENIQVRDFIPWKKVSYLMAAQWTHLQALNRWERNLKPQSKGEPWSPEEDAVLCLGVPAIGACWAKFSQILHGRSSFLCRERFVNILDPNLLTGSWTLEDDQKLLLSIVEYGERWGKISRKFPERTDNMVNQRAQKLCAANPELYEKILMSSTVEKALELLPKRQIVQSKRCIFVNEKRKRIRNAAFMSAQNALEQVFGHQIDLQEFSTFEDLASIINMSNLKKIADILLPKGGTVLRRPVNCYNKRPIKKEVLSCIKTEVMDMAFNDGINDQISSDGDEYQDVEFSDDLSDIVKIEDRDIVYAETENAIREQFYPLAVLGPLSDKRAHVKDGKESLELSIVRRYFFKGMKLKNSDQYDENGDNLYNINYSETVTRVIMFFVFPVCEDEEIMVVPPNLPSITACVLFPMYSNYVDANANNVLPITLKEIELVCYDLPSYMVICPYCEGEHDSQKNGNQSNNVTSTGACRCNMIKKHILSWKMFSSHIISILSWNWLMTRVPPNIYQLQSSIFWNRSTMTDRFKCFKESKIIRKKKRGRKRKQVHCYPPQVSEYKYEDDEVITLSD